MAKFGRLITSSIFVLGLVHCGTEDDSMVDVGNFGNSSRSEVINGVEASDDLVVRQGVLFFINRRGRALYECGTSYIGEGSEGYSWAVTAAHCVSFADNFAVGFGQARYSDYTDENRIPVEEIVVFPRYDLARLRNDIALLRLSEKPEATPSLLAWPARDAKQGEQLRIAGFGATNDRFRPRSLLEIETNVADRRACRNSEVFDNDIHICLRDRKNNVEDINQSTCSGDSGSAAYRDNMVLVGLVSFAPFSSDVDGDGFPDDICDPELPEVHTRVSKFRWWISQVTGI